MELDRKSKPAVGLATLQDEGHGQVASLRTVRTIAARYAAKWAELTPDKYSEEHRQQRTAEIRNEVALKLDWQLAEMLGRADRARQALESWDPATRRLRASLREPVGAAALASRLALVPIGQLPELAREAAAKGDWLLADAVATQRPRLEAARATIESQEIEKALGAMDAEGVAEAREVVQTITNHYAQAVQLAAEAADQPLSGKKLVELAFAYAGTDAPSPAA